MQIGVITVDGRMVGVITQSMGDDVDTFTPDLGAGDNPLRPDIAPGSGASPHHHWARRHAGEPVHTPHHGAPDHAGGYYKHHAPGHEAPDALPAPEAGGSRVYGRLASARDRAREELASHPALKEKMFSIAAGENMEPRANQSVMESMVNRMAVRGTDLETQVRRYGHEPGGYYAGYNPNYSRHDRAVMEQSLSNVLNYSNVSNYATDNSSNQPGNNLAERDVASGRFTERSVYNREHFFAPNLSNTRHRDTWRSMVNESEADANKIAADKKADRPFNPDTDPL